MVREARALDLARRRREPSVAVDAPGNRYSEENERDECGFVPAPDEQGARLVGDEGARALHARGDVAPVAHAPDPRRQRVVGERGRVSAESLLKIQPMGSSDLKVERAASLGFDIIL